MEVIKLRDFGESNFVNVLTKLADTSQDRNKDWFPALLKKYKMYNDWYFVVNDSELVAFSTIQEFYTGCFRMLTRCYITPKYRRPVLPKNDTVISPASMMILMQLPDIVGYDTAFISLENISRSRTIINMSTKMKNTTRLDWQVLPGMMQTCVNIESQSCWQNVCYTGIKPTLPTIPKELWILKNGK